MTEHALASAPTIRPLPALLVNQIAAGEVIERPASVVKELVENALDAGASRIRVALEGGGVELIEVADDGCGIEAQQLGLALAPHATSKIELAADLDRIATLGFRGEALASIASVSRMTIRSRPAGASGGAEIAAEGEAIGPVRPASCSEGTVVTVRNLFFNTPARRKFLRTASTEQNRCRDWLVDLAMARPAVAFALACDGRELLDLPAEQGPRDRALALLGAELQSELVGVEFDAFDGGAAGIGIWGLAGLPSIARATNKAQHVFINGRAVRDRVIQHALREAYRGLIEPGRHPTAVLMIEMPPDAVDVNVHPAKLEVRFREQSAIYSAVLRSVREALQRADLTPSLPGPAESRAARAGDREILPAPRPSAEGFVDFFKREVPARAGGRFDFESIRRAVQEADAAPKQDAAPGEASAPAHQPSRRDTLLDVRPAMRVLQVHEQYLVTQDERGLLIVDQHALHERVMFERLLERVRRGPLESQPLLSPAVCPASEAQLEAVEPLGPLLERVGIAAAPLGPRSLGVQAFATILFERGVDPAAFMSELLDRAAERDFPPDEEDALREVLDMMACKAAIKAGDKLEGAEIEELLQMREHVERSSSCPHGRPTSIRLTLGQLDRMFGRT